MISLRERRKARPQNPYVGPRPFRTGDRLYGREREARELEAMVVAERIVLLHSPSGAGKTSLLQAAVMPALRRRRFRVYGTLRVNAAPPEGTSVDNRYVWSVVCNLLGPRAATDPATRTMTICDALAQLPDDADDGDGRPLKGTVLVFDQFEEILTLDPTDRAAKSQFFEEVGEALEALDRWAIFSMREDYMGGLARLAPRLPTHLRVRERLDFLEVPAALRAVQEPAKEHGVMFTDAAARALVDDLRKVNVQWPGQEEPKPMDGPYVEPVQLQVVCNRMWRKLARDLGGSFTKIEPEHVHAYGDFDRALSDYYAEAVANVAEEMKVSERAIRDWIDDRLITRRGFRSQHPTGPQVDHVDEVLAKLERRYLIRSDDRGGTRWHELTHDRLVRPVRENNREWRLRNLGRWDAAADEWRRSDRQSSYLIVGPDVWEAQKWLRDQDEDVAPVTREFIEASRNARGNTLAARWGKLAGALFWIALLEAAVIVVLLLR